jgi:hypothetical protein
LEKVESAAMVATYYRRNKQVATLLLAIKKRYPDVPKDIRVLSATYVKIDLTTGWTDSTGNTWEFQPGLHWDCTMNRWKSQRKYTDMCRHCLAPMVMPDEDTEPYCPKHLYCEIDVKCSGNLTILRERFIWE